MYRTQNLIPVHRYIWVFSVYLSTQNEGVFFLFMNFEILTFYAFQFENIWEFSY